MSIKTNIEEITKEVDKHGASLIAVSKTKPVELLLEAYNAGIRDFGENKVQELVEKEQQLPNDIRWHMIGHLQRNKVKFIVPFVYLIHGVDSFKVLKEIDKQGAKVGRKINCLLQVHIAEEDTKFGFSREEITKLLQEQDFAAMEHIVVSGLMGMATFTEDTSQIRREFKALRELYDSLSKQYAAVPNVEMKILSMGMSGDYQIALEEGSNMIRVGSSIFGARSY